SPASRRWRPSPVHPGWPTRGRAVPSAPTPRHPSPTACFAASTRSRVAPPAHERRPWHAAPVLFASACPSGSMPGRDRWRRSRCVGVPCPPASARVRRRRDTSCHAPEQTPLSCPRSPERQSLLLGHEALSGNGRVGCVSLDPDEPVPESKRSHASGAGSTEGIDHEPLPLRERVADGPEHHTHGLLSWMLPALFAVLAKIPVPPI